jgi:hypothetical protein
MKVFSDVTALVRRALEFPMDGLRFRIVTIFSQLARSIIFHEGGFVLRRWTLEGLHLKALQSVDNE